MYKCLANKIIFKNAFFKKHLVDDKMQDKIVPSGLLGVIIRGTDYIKLKPKYHPAQPEVDEVITKVRDVIDTGHYKGISNR